MSDLSSMPFDPERDRLPLTPSADRPRIPSDPEFARMRTVRELLSPKDSRIGTAGPTAADIPVNNHNNSDYQRHIRRQHSAMAEAIEHSENPDEELGKAATSAYLADKIGWSPEDVMDRFEEATELYFGNKVDPIHAFEAVRRHIDRGYVSWKTSQEAMMISRQVGTASELTPEQEQQFQSVLNQLNDMPAEDNTHRTWLTRQAIKTVGALGEQLPRMVHAWARSGSESMAVGLGAAALFSMKAIPASALAGLPGLTIGAISSGTVGLAAAATHMKIAGPMNLARSYEGSAFIEIMSQTTEDGQRPHAGFAAASARVAGILAGVSEFATVRMIPGIAQLRQRAAQVAMQDVVQGTMAASLLKGYFRNPVMKNVARWGVSTSLGVLNEVYQETAQMVGVELALRLDEGVTNNVWERPTVDAIMDRYWEIAEMSARSYGLMAFVGGAVQTYRDVQAPGARAREIVSNINTHRLEIVKDLDMERPDINKLQAEYDRQIDQFKNTRNPRHAVEALRVVSQMDRVAAEESGRILVEGETESTVQQRWQLTPDEYNAAQPLVASQFQSKLMEAADMSQGEAKAATAFVKAYAKRAGMDLQEYIDTRLVGPGINAANTVAGFRGGFQPVVNSITGEVKGIIHLTENSDFSTVAHEITHVEFERALSGQESIFDANDVGILTEWAEGLTDDRDYGMTQRPDSMSDADYALALNQGELWTMRTFTHEKVAEALEQYLIEGVAPTSRIAQIFAKFKELMRDIYDSFRSSPDVNMSDDVRSVFDRVFSQEANHIVQPTALSREGITYTLDQPGRGGQDLRFAKPDQVERARAGRRHEEQVAASGKRAAPPIVSVYNDLATMVSPLVLTKETTQDVIQRAADSMSADLFRAFDEDLQHITGAMDWYENDIKHMRSKLAVEMPELADDNWWVSFLAIVGATSNGINPSANIWAAASIMKFWLRTKVLPLDFFEIGNKYKGRVFGLTQTGTLATVQQNRPVIADKLQQMGRIAEKLDYDPEKIGQWLTSEHTGRDILSMVDAKTISEIKLTEMYNGIEFNGPKTGQFALALSGRDMLVKDRWWVRSWNRTTGTPFSQIGMDLEAARAHSREMEQLIADSPRNTSERRAMEAAAEQVRQRLQEHVGREFKISQVQAMMWVLEKALYEDLGVPSRTQTSFKEAIDVREGLLHERRTRTSGKGFETQSPEAVVEQLVKEHGALASVTWEGVSRELLLTDNHTRLLDTPLVGREPLFFQRAEINTPEFRNWFQNSKVVDAKGQPLTLYHGSPYFLEDGQFSKAMMGSATNAADAFDGIYFSDSKEVAEGYALQSDSAIDEAVEREYQLMLLDAESDAQVAEIEQAYSEGWIEETIRNDPQTYLRVNEVYVSMQNPYVVDYHGQVYQDVAYAQAIDIAKANGHDGVHLKNTIDSFGSEDIVSNVYIVFEPTQIKDVNNVGTWSVDDPRIMFQRKNTDTAEFRRWFEGSVVVDENGDPRVYYHGTTSRSGWDGTQDFREFATDADLEMGSHFGVVEQAEDFVANGVDGSRIFPVYLSISNPLRLQDTGSWSPNVVLDQITKLGVISRDASDAIRRQSGDYLSRNVRRAIEDAGYDGIVYLNRGEGLLEAVDAIDWEISEEAFAQLYPRAKDSYIVFAPEQIKSVFNKGMWSSMDPDILYQKGEVSLEARPGLTTGNKYTWMSHLDYAEQTDLLSRVMNAVRGTDGLNELAQEFGLKGIEEILVPGVWADQRNPSIQMQFDAQELTPALIDQVESFAASIGYFFMQDAVGWNRPDAQASIEEQNNVILDAGRVLTLDETIRVVNFLERTHGDSLAIVGAPEGLRILNFGDTPGPEIAQGLSDYIVRTGALDVEQAITAVYGIDGGLVENNWQEAPNGEGYIHRISTAGSSGIFERNAVRLSQAVESTYAGFEQEFRQTAEERARTLTQRDRERRQGTSSPLKSGLAVAVGLMDFKTMPAKNLLNRLSKMPGIKSDEIKWTGLDEFLADDRKVTKEEVEQYIEANRVPIREIVKTNRDVAEVEAAVREETDRLYAEAADEIKYSSMSPDSLREVLSRTARLIVNDMYQTPEYSRYKLNSSTIENYKEIVMFLSDEADQKEAITAQLWDVMGDLTERHRGELTAMMPPDTFIYPSVWTMELIRQIAPDELWEYDRLRAQQLNVPVGRDRHYPGIKNQIVSSRMEQIKTLDGENVAFIEEIQSDYFQQPADERTIGITEKELNDFNRLIQEYDKMREKDASFLKPFDNNDEWSLARFEHQQTILGGLTEITDKYGGIEATRERFARFQAGDREAGIISDATLPLKSGWAETAFRRSVLEAIQAYPDAKMIGLTTGDIQEARWGEHSGTRRHYDSTLRKYMEKFAKKFGSQIEVVALDATDRMPVNKSIPDSMLPRNATSDARKATAVTEVRVNRVTIDRDQETITFTEVDEDGNELVAVENHPGIDAVAENKENFLQAIEAAGIPEEIGWELWGVHRDDQPEFSAYDPEGFTRDFEADAFSVPVSLVTYVAGDDYLTVSFADRAGMGHDVNIYFDVPEGNITDAAERDRIVYDSVIREVQKSAVEIDTGDLQLITDSISMQEDLNFDMNIKTGTPYTVNPAKLLGKSGQDIVAAWAMPITPEMRGEAEGTGFMLFQSNAEAWWFHGEELLESEQTHIRTVLNTPEKFGYTKQDLIAKYKEHGEKIGQEAKAREQIIKELNTKDWVRVRHYRRPQDYWSLTVGDMDRQWSVIEDFLIYAMEHLGMHLNDQLQIVSTESEQIKVWKFQEGGVKAALDDHYNLHQRDPHYKSVEHALDSGMWVEDAVLGEYMNESWAKAEVDARNDLRLEAQQFDTFEEFLDYVGFADSEPHSSYYYSEIWRTAKDLPRGVREVNNTDWTAALSNEKIIALVGQVGLDRKTAQLDNKALKDLAKYVQTHKSSPNDAMVQAARSVLAEDPGKYRQMLSDILGDDAEMMTLIEEDFMDGQRVAFEREVRENQKLREQQKINEEILGTQKAEIRRARGRKSAKDAVKDYRSRAKERQYRAKLIRKILKDPSAAIDHGYASQIRDIQGEYYTNRSKRMDEMQEVIRSYLDENDPGGTHLKKVLSMRRLQDLTTMELENLWENINGLINEGRMQRWLTVLDEKAEVARLAESIAEEVMQGDDRIVEEMIGSVQDSRAKKASIATMVKKGTWRPSRIARMLAGGKEGAAFQLLVTQVNQATDAELQGIERRVAAADARMKELGITHSQLNQVRATAGGYEFRVDDILSIYIAMQNEDSTAAVMYGNKISMEDIHSLIDTLSESELHWAEFLMGDFGEENFNRIAETLLKDENRSMPRVERYFPMLRQGRDYEFINQEVAEDILGRTSYARSYASKNFTKSRIKISPQHQTPIRLGATAIWNQQVAKQEKYISSAPLVKKLHRVFNDPQVTSAIRQKYGQAMNDWTRKFINDFANPDIYRSTTDLDKLSRIARSHAAMSYLGMNLVTMGKQLPSVAFYLSRSGPGYLISSIGKFLSDPKKAVEFAHANDPQAKSRSINRFQEELRLMNKEGYEGFVRQVGSMTMAGIKLMDTMAVTIGWNAVYDRMIADGYSHQEAVQEAQLATLETQPAARAKDLAEIYRSSEGLNWFLMFSNQLNQIWNMFTADIPNDIRHQNVARALLTATGIAISATVIGWMSHRDVPEDSDEVPGLLGKYMRDQFLSSVPIVGGSVKAGMEGWFGTGVDPVPVASQAGRAIRTYANSDADGGQKFDATMRLIMESMVTAGLPSVQTRRIHDTFFAERWFQDPQVDLWELIGGLNYGDE